MIEYILGGAFLTGVGLAVVKYYSGGRYYRKFKKAIKENKRIFDSFTPEVIDKLADRFNQSQSEKKDLFSKIKF